MSCVEMNFFIQYEYIQICMGACLNFLIGTLFEDFLLGGVCMKSSEILIKENLISLFSRTWLLHINLSHIYIPKILGGIWNSYEYLIRILEQKVPFGTLEYTVVVWLFVSLFISPIISSPQYCYFSVQVHCQKPLATMYKFTILFMCSVVWLLC